MSRGGSAGSSPVGGRGVLPHPVSGVGFASPVPAGTGWPGDPAGTDTPVARTAADVSTWAKAAPDLAALDAAVSVCRACPRLVAWREDVARVGRAAYADQPYWGRPAPSFGDPHPRLLVVGLAPAAHGANRTGRMFTGDRSGDWLYAALHRAGLATLATSQAAGDGQILEGVRITAPVHCAPPANSPTAAERATCHPWLDRELELVGAGLTGILALGKIGWDATVSALRGAGWTLPRPMPAFGHGVWVDVLRPHPTAVAEPTAPTAPTATAGSRGSSRAVADHDDADDHDLARRSVRLVGSYHVSQQNTFTGRLTEPMLDAAIALALAGPARQSGPGD